MGFWQRGDPGKGKSFVMCIKFISNKKGYFKFTLFFLDYHYTCSILLSKTSMLKIKIWKESNKKRRKERTKKYYFPSNYINSLSSKYFLKQFNAYPTSEECSPRVTFNITRPSNVFQISWSQWVICIQGKNHIPLPFLRGHLQIMCSCKSVPTTHAELCGPTRCRT